MKPRGTTRLAALLAGLATCSLLAAACGSSGDDSATAEAEDVAAEPADTTVAPAAGGDAAATEGPDEELEAGVEADDDAGGQAGPGDALATDDTVPTDVDDSTEGEEAPADEDAAGEGDEESALGSGGATVTPTAADLGRHLIFTAQIHLGVDDVGAASAEATDIMEGLGGFLFGQDTTGGNEPRSELVFKVLPDDFDAALAALGEVGELRNQTVSTDDVTERVVDLESRIEVAELGVERLRGALDGAATLEDYAEIEELLLAREGELEIMRGQLRTLQDQIDLATITLTLTEDRVENAIQVAISTYEGHDDGQTCPGEVEREGQVEAGSPVTVCFDIVNNGDQTLTDITLTDTVLEIDADTELIEVFATLDELPPGQAALLAYEINPERDLNLRTRVVAVPTDGVNPEPTGPSVNVEGSHPIDTFEPETPPGFGDGFSAAVTVLQAIWVAAKLVAGFLIPLLVFAPFLAAIWWARRQLRARRPPPPPPPAPPSPSPAPPAPEPVGASAQE